MPGGPTAKTIVGRPLRSDVVWKRVPQVYRVTDYYGKAIEVTVNACRTLKPIRQSEVQYMQVDGTMQPAGNEGWKEVKVGRFFKSSDCLLATKRGWVGNLQYAAHSGNCTNFTKIMEPIIESYGKLGRRLVIIFNGALWIKNWIEDAFSDAVSVLDYYHAWEHLYSFSFAFFNDKGLEMQWAGRQKEMLMQGNVLEALNNIRAIAPGNQEAEQLVSYYRGNIRRLEYHEYKKIGYGIIGSGA